MLLRRVLQVLEIRSSPRGEVPPEMEMPPNRARPGKHFQELLTQCERHFWQQLDTDGNGKDLMSIYRHTALAG